MKELRRTFISYRKQLIDQLTGFYMIGTMALDGLKEISFTFPRNSLY